LAPDPVELFAVDVALPSAVVLAGVHPAFDVVAAAELLVGLRLTLFPAVGVLVVRVGLPSVGGVPVHGCAVRLLGDRFRIPKQISLAGGNEYGESGDDSGVPSDERTGMGVSKIHKSLQLRPDGILRV
jgi:hypothetical protein